MLKLKDISDSVAIRNKSVFYVKISIEFDNLFKYHSPILYWNNYGGKQDTYLEIKLIEKNGAINQFIVVTMPQKTNLVLPTISENAIEKIGLPLFETSLWVGDKYHFRERLPGSGDFGISVKDETVYILLLHNEVVLKVINDNIVFGFDKNNVLCFIQMAGMKLNEEGFLEKIN